MPDDKHANEPERFNFRRLLRPSHAPASIEAIARKLPDSVRIEAHDLLSRSAEFLVVVNEGTSDELSLVADVNQVGGLYPAVLREVSQLIRRYARYGRLRDLADEEPEDRCPCCHGLARGAELDDAEDFRALRRLLHRRADRLSKRERELAAHGEPQHFSPDDVAANDAQARREFQALLGEHDERRRLRGQGPTEMVD